MLFIVRILRDGRAHWSVTVEAEDRDGAVREAMAALAAGDGRYASRAAPGALTVEVEAVSRDFARATITGLLA